MPFVCVLAEDFSELAVALGSMTCLQSKTSSSVAV